MFLLLLALQNGCSAPTIAVETVATVGAPRTAKARLSPPSDPGEAASPYDDALPHPDLKAPKSDFDLELLGYRYDIYSFEADMSSLLRVRDPQGAMSKLAADPRWRVGVLDGAVVAFQRERDPGGWTVTRHGFHAEPASVWRTAVRFTPWSPQSDWADDIVARYDAATSPLRMRSFTLQDGQGAGLPSTAVTIDGECVALDLFEATRDPGRPHTIDAMSELPSYLDALATGQWWYPREEPARDVTTHVHVAYAGDGILEVRGRANPGTPGWTWLRILDNEGQAWQELAVATGTREFVGGSTRPDEQFYFQSQFGVASGDRFSGTAEVWFKPEGVSAPQRIASYPVLVPAR